MTDVYFRGELMDKSLVNLTLEMVATTPKYSANSKKSKNERRNCCSAHIIKSNQIATKKSSINSKQRSSERWRNRGTSPVALAYCMGGRCRSKAIMAKS